MLIQDGFAIDATDGEVNYTAQTFHFSWETEPAKNADTPKPRPARAKKEDFQMQLF